MTQPSSSADKARCPVLGQFLCFSGIGVIGTLAHYTTLITLVQMAGVTPVLASAGGFVLGALVNYVLNYRYTFRSNSRHHEAIIKFFTIALVGLVLNTLIISLAIDILSLHYLLAQVIATGLVLIWNFTGNRWWTFREATNAPEY